MDDRMEEQLLPAEGEGDIGSDTKGKIWRESKKMWRIAFPSMVARVSSFGTLVVTQSFMGHISELDLAAYALMQTIGVRFVNGILLGMSSATETLCGQAFGAGQCHMMGIYLQRSWVVDLVTATILVPAFVFAKPIFRILGQEEDIARVAGQISLWFIPFLYCLVFSLTIRMYLQAQLKNMVIGWLSALSFVLHLLLSWIFVEKLNLGMPGAMGALNISSWSVVIGEFIYIFGGWCPHTWKGFTRDAFSDMLPVVKLSVSSGVMLCLELWYNAVLVLIAGYMKHAETAISAFSICLNISTWEFMIFFGFLGAASVRVSNELGRGNAYAAKFSIKVILSTSVCLGVIFWILCLAFRHEISHLFTSNEEIAKYVSSLSVLLAFSMLLNSVQPILTGVAIGAGLQGVVAIVNICSYYVVGVPLGVLLGYVAHLQITGLWIGMLCGVAIQSSTLIILVWRTNWEYQVSKALERLNKWFIKPSEDTDQNPVQFHNNK
ncbi:protein DETOXIFICATION 24 isoform X1 [Malania oleifera]|uniref:protein DETOXIFICATION 24 isoform X1 n=1 Tax=Malania oleifera TaxID=397392 RepID=UPI0025AEC460|nr:protein DETOXIFICATION 24 isoform X1 [Malania oleifera]